MPNAKGESLKTSLDKDLDKVTYVEEATHFATRRFASLGAGLLFLIICLIFAAVNIGNQSGAYLIVAAAVIGGYMAINIGANDVTNNIGPLVGARALTLPIALVIAAIAEICGALLAGDGVVDTISSGIINSSTIADADILIGAMLASLLAAALWVNFATVINAPVSTTHAIVGAVIGAGVAASGFGAIDWASLGTVAFGWLLSPFLSGFVAIGFLKLIEQKLIIQTDKLSAARQWVPILIGIMMGIFASFVCWIGLSHVIDIPLWLALLIGSLVYLISWRISIPLIRRQSAGLENRNQSLKLLFRWPLIIAATALSFAHGANDVSNAVGPVAAIVRASSGNTGAEFLAPAQIWVMLIGAFGLSVGIMLFGPRLIRLVGDQITKLNPLRAFCVSLATALTVLLASAFGLPLSTTHTAVGAVFGIGLYREWQAKASAKQAAVARLKEVRNSKHEPYETNQAETRRRYLVRRSHLLTILAAWAVTVPISALFSAILYWFIFQLFI
jgi:PiT family inorganic phosphate transporter